jgi:hypothetical protein
VRQSSCSLPMIDEFRDIARGIEEKLPDWLVLWGVYTRQFIAFPLFDAPRGTILTANYPDALVDRIRDAERRLGRSSEKGGSSADDA